MKRKEFLKKLTAWTLSLAMALTPVVGANAAGQEKAKPANNIENDIFWHDTAGNPIFSQGGGIFKFTVGGVEKYYWYGVKYEECETYYNNPSKALSVNHFAGVTCYSSTDLTNWTYEGDVVVPSEVTNRAEMDNQPVEWVGRLGVAYMEDTQTYAMFVQHECPDPDNKLDVGQTDNYSKQVLVLTSNSPTGQFEWNQRIDMRSYTGGTTNTGDQTVFTDEDTGKDYLVYSYGSGRGKIFISEIETQADGKVGLAKAHMVYHGAGREGNCMFKYNNKYYICASDLYGWNASHAYYLTLDSLEDSYLDSFKTATAMQLMPGCSDDFCHVTQTGFFYTVKGSAQDTVIFCGDRWADFAGNGLGYNQWCPLSFETDGTPYYNSLSSWNLDAATGEWEVEADNNYVKNGSFDADRISVSQMQGWKNTVREGNSPINNNGTRVTGKYALRLGDSVDFDCTISQTVASSKYVTLADGNYNLTAKVRNSGTFDDLQMYAKSGTVKQGTSISAASDWTTVTLENISVTGGKVEIGFEADGKANAWCNVDDVTLVKSTDTTLAKGTISGTIDSDVAGSTLKITAAQKNGTEKYTQEVVLAAGSQSFTISPVKAGEYTVSADSYGCQITAENNNVTVSDGQTASGIVFHVTGNMGTVKGKVVDDVAEAVSGATVTLAKAGQTTEVTTDSKGEYEFANIEAGEYTLSFAKTGHASVENVKVTVTKNQTTTAATQILARNTGSIAGRVYDTAGNPKANATVALRGCRTVDDTTRVTAKTDANGNYSFENVVEGTYTLTAYTGTANASVNAAAHSMAVAAGQKVAVNLDIPEEITVVNGGFENGDLTGWTSSGTSGKASNDKGHKHVCSGDWGYTTWKSSAFTIKLEQTLTNLENGTYVVQMMAAGGDYGASDDLNLYAKSAGASSRAASVVSKERVPETIGGGWELIALTVEVTDGTMTFGVEGNMSGGAWVNFDDFKVGKVKEVHEPVSGGTISGKVCDASGAAAANATVMLRGCGADNETARATTQADAAGNYSFENVAAGTYAVSASAGNWNASVNAIAQNVEVVKDTTKTVNLTLPTEVTIVNGGFENGDLTGWTSTGSSGKASNDKKHNHVYQGDWGYTTWKGSAFTIKLEQTLTNCTNGTYVVHVTAAGGTYGASDELYLYAKNSKGDVIAREKITATLDGGWELFGLTAAVTDGTLTFGLDGNMSANAWINFDDFRVGRLEDAATADKTELEELITEVQGFDTSAYTSASVSEYEEAMKDAFDAAKTIKGKDAATQDEVDGAVEALNTAFEAGKKKLVKLETKLEQEIEESIKTVEDEKGYTPESWAVYQAALQKVQGLKAGGKFTEAQMNVAIADLQKAVAGLQKAGSNPGVETPTDPVVPEKPEKPNKPGKPGTPNKPGTPTKPNHKPNGTVAPDGGDSEMSENVVLERNDNASTNKAEKNTSAAGANSTGDNAPIALYALMIAMAAVVCLGVCIERKKTTIK